MRAVRFQGVGRPPMVCDVPKPDVGPGQILVKMGGAGLCSSDLHLLHQDFGLPCPFTFGHENAGWVSDLGAGVTGFKEGDAVAVYICWGCGHCHNCQQSAENYCETVGLGAMGGLGLDGGMAEYMLVPNSRLLVPLGDLQPRKSAPLNDAALTPYHAIKRVLPYLHADATAVILGIGGLGHMAVQLMRILAPVRIIAGDVDPIKLAHAKELGADYAVNTRDADSAAEEIRKITGGRGVDVVLDCAGVQPTFDLAPRVLKPNSQWMVVGLGGGVHKYEHGSLPYGVSLTLPFGGTRLELMEVIAMARDGRIHVDTTEFALEAAADAFAKLEAGQIKGRAVFNPELA